MLVGGLDQAVAGAGVLDAVADGMDAGHGGLQPVVDEDAAPRRQAGGLGERRIGAHAHRHHHQPAGNALSILQLDALDGRRTVNRPRLRLQQDADALGLERPFEEPRAFGVELALHQPVHQVDKRDRHAGARQAVSRLDAEQPAADHDGGYTLRRRGLQVGNVGKRAERRHAGKGIARQREPDGLGACRQNARIERQDLAVTQHELAPGRYRARPRAGPS